jgi:hypothetical protein
MYKIGDLVVIKKRIGSDWDYPLVYIDEMLQFHGNIARIIGIKENLMSSRYKELLYYNGDRNIYYLDIDNKAFMWSSSMFESYNPRFINLNNILN